MTVLSKPSDVTAPVREVGGDNEVPRDSKGRPRVLVKCSKCDGAGTVSSEKTGKPVKCKAGCGPTKSEPEIPVGFVFRSYTRTTTFIDVLEDKSNLQAWGERMVLVGLALDPKLMDGVRDLYDEQKAAESALRTLEPSAGTEARKAAQEAVRGPKNELNKRAKIAKEKAGAEDKADKGTELHGLSELVDQGLALPHGISFADAVDMAVYARMSAGFKIVHMERLVVCDELKVGGTPDRVSMWEGDEPLVAPDGELFERGDGKLLITDLKTGTTEYGQLKMAMQLAIYSRSALYDWRTGDRSPLGNVNQKWGVIMNLPAGAGYGQLYWANLELGWEAVQVAQKIRHLRGVGAREALVPFK